MLKRRDLCPWNLTDGGSGLGGVPQYGWCSVQSTVCGSFVCRSLVTGQPERTRDALCRAAVLSCVITGKWSSSLSNTEYVESTLSLCQFAVLPTLNPGDKQMEMAKSGRRSPSTRGPTGQGAKAWAITLQNTQAYAECVNCNPSTQHPTTRKIRNWLLI